MTNTTSFAKLQELLLTSPLLDVVRTFFFSPELCYEDFEKEDSLNKYLLNYLDSLLFGSCPEALHTSTFLQKMLKKNRDSPLNKLLPIIQRDLSFIKLFLQPRNDLAKLLNKKDVKQKWNALISYLLLEKRNQFLTETQTDSIPSLFPSSVAKTLKQQILFRQNIHHFLVEHPSLSKLFGINQIPFLPLSYPAPTQLQEKLEKELSQERDKIPLLLMDPMRLNWKKIVDLLEDKKAIFAFLNLPTLLQCLQFPDIRKSLSNKNHLTLILNNYPSAQLNIQPSINTFKKDFFPVVASTSTLLSKHKKLITKSLTACTQQHMSNKINESPAANWIYHIGKNLHFLSIIKKFGRNHYPVLHRAIGIDRWYDPHKGAPPDNVEKAPPLPNLLDDTIKTLALPKRKARTFTTEKLKIGHVVSHMIDGGHAPTRNLLTILKHHNRELFDIYLYTSEMVAHRSCEYPYTPHMSPLTVNRAPKIIYNINQMNIPIRLGDNKDDFVTTAQNLSQKLTNDKIDIVLFHGNDIVNSMTTAITDTPYRVFHDYGALPKHKGFDLIIASADEVFKKHKTFYKTLDTEIDIVPMSVDCKEMWTPKPLPKAFFGLPSQSQILTTISNHLDTRLSNEMLTTIVTILKQNPQAFYLPMGAVNKGREFMHFFSQNGVGDRVKFLGQVASPSQLVRSMDLYLNEFPFGGGFALLEAMSAGCPIVTMYDEKAPIQGRVGGIYFDKNKAITSCNKEEYINLANELLRNKEKRKEWSQFALKRYDEQVNPQAYVEKLENSLLQHSKATAFIPS